MRLATAIVVIVLAAVAPAAARAQEVAHEKAFDQHLFPPELVMQNQQKIGLRADQRTTITEAIQQLQGKVVDLQWKMQEESQKLADVLAKSPVSEPETLAQVDRVLAIERDVKRAHMTMLIRIRNALTADQQAMLRSLR
jgi:Spy/CpxP family protein refolding chaperone